MNNCETCKHWKTAEEHEPWQGFGLGRCQNVPMFWNATEWDEDGVRTVRDQYKNIKAFTQDGSDYRAYLLTRPDFGCVSHEVDVTGATRSASRPTWSR